MRGDTGNRARNRFWTLPLLLLPVSVWGNPPDSGPDFFERTLRSDLVIHGRVRTGSLRLAEIDILEILRGEFAGERLFIAFRHLNSTRKPWEERIRFLKDEEVLLFLKPARKQPPEGDRFELVRRWYGKFSLPGEGSQAYLEGVRRFAEIASSHPSQHWDRLLEMLEDENPVVVTTALRQTEKHQLVTQARVTVLLRLLRKTGDRDRLRAAHILEQFLSAARARREQLKREEDVVNLLIAAARNDASELVRAAAVRALRAWASPKSVEALENIARIDPSQSVRFEAERCLLEIHRIPGGTEP